MEEGNYKAIRQLPKVKIEVSYKVGTARVIRVDAHDRTARNTSAASSAFMVRLKAVPARKRGDRILPAIYSDNYITLMPGETQVDSY